jgi:ribosomal protein S18 acetylase RimI-like enzyme
MTGDPFDDAWLARIEDAGVNATAPREQLWVDGWLVRFAAGKAKRARSIQPAAPGRLTIEAKLARCRTVFAAAELPLIVRITRFAEPPGLDAHLAGLGMARFDDSLVMALTSLDEFDDDNDHLRHGGDSASEAVTFEAVDPTAFAESIGAARGSSARERASHADRLANAPVPHHAIVVRDAREGVVAGGQVAVEATLGGLYDIFTIAEARGRGLGKRVCRHLLAHARRRGASAAYLQVDAGNDVARRLYARLGFRDAYPYHYRAAAAG